ncbi:tetratricopeptide repeat protein [Actinomyces oris]|uniref:tetratricopeptide repeat protein n=1 Tax=Actinomyces oris TaxID=544580 RepID=UPI0028EB95C6|nr:tetratricopeptide repeat protein [Actinomyces oris]
MVHALLGEHQNVVDLLLERLEALRDPGCDLPRVVVLSGSAGSGKTRIVQELYARLRSDREDAYWPAMGDAVRTRGGAGTDPMAGRKVVAPRIDGFVWPAGALPTFGWWGLSCERLATGNSQDVVSAMRSQLGAHALPLAMARRQVEGWKDKARRLAGEAVEEVRSAFIDEGLSAAFDALKRRHISIPFGATLVKWGFKGMDASWRRVQELNRLKCEFLLGEQDRSIQRTASQQLADMLISLSHRDLPTVIAIEDMHLMGRELPAFLDAVSSRRSSPMLVVGTVWPEGENNGVYRRWLSKAQIRGVVQHVKIPVLGVDDLSRMIQEEAPRTSKADLLQVAGRLNNPYLIRLWLTERRTQEHIESHDGAVVLADENIRFPEDVVVVLKARWDELDDAVRTGLLYAAAISPDIDGCACRFVSEVVAGVVNRREPDAHYDARMGLRRAIEKLCWCRSEQGIDFFAEPLLVEYLRSKADSYFGKEGWRQLRLLTQDALAEWICRRIDGVDLPPTEVSMFVCQWFLGVDDGERAGALVIARAAAQWCLARNAESCDEVGDAVERGKKALAALLVKNPLSEKVALNLRLAVASYVLRSGESKDALNRYSDLLSGFERVFGIHHPKTMLVRYGRAKAMVGVGRLEDSAVELKSLLNDQSAALGGGHPDSWATRSKLVEVLKRLGCTEESLALCDEGEGVPEVDSVAHELLPVGLLRVVALMGDKSTSVAVDACRDLLSGVEKEFGFDHENVLAARSNLAAALSRDNRWGEAVAEYRMLVQGYERVLGSDNPDMLTARSNLAQALLNAGREEAIEAFEMVLRDYLRVLGSDHPDTLVTRCNLAEALRGAGRVEEAIETGQAALTDCLRVLGADHSATLVTRCNLVEALQGAGRVEEALEACQAVLTDQLRVLGPNHPDTLTTRNNLAGALWEVGRVEEAIDSFQAALSGRLRVLGPNHPDTLITRGNHAGALREVGRVEEAIRAYQALLTEQLRVLGPNHPDTLKTRGNLAGALREVGRVEEAIRAYQALLTDRLQVLGADHPDTLITRNNLAGALWDAGWAEEAIRACQALLTDQLRVLGPNHPGTLATRNNLAGMLREVGRVEEALEACQAVLDDRLRVLGPDHPDTLKTRGNLAGALWGVGRAEEAVGAYQAVLDDQLRVLGPNHPDTLTTRGNLAGALRCVGRAEEAVGAYQAVLDDQLRVLGPNHPDTLKTRDNLVKMLNAEGRFDEAVLVYQSILEARLSSSDPDDPDVLDARDDLAWALGRAECFDEALADYLKLIADYERVMGVDDPDTLTARNNYICTLKNSGKIVEAVALYRELLSDVERALGAGDEFAQEITQRLSEWGSDL